MNSVEWVGCCCVLFQAEDGIRAAQEYRGLGEVYKRQGGRSSEIKYKARGVLAGNSIQSKGTPAHELFTEVAQTPASLTSARAALAAGALKGHRGTVRDATTAYLQAKLKTHHQDGSEMPSQWVRLPRTWWPATWFNEDGTSKFYDPVVRFRKALHGHPESEAIWDKHLAPDSS